jgi:SAM-dependent methyltransferase
MGVPLNLGVLLKEMCARYAWSGDVLTLGEQSMGFDAAALERMTGGGEHAFGPIAQRDFFRAIGFASSASADIDASEGADYTFDFNRAETPADLIGRFDVVLNGGTLEHVFNAPSAFAHVTRLLKPDGVAIHVTPCNNWVDHGFYQFSPTLLFDYYRSAGFDAVESALAIAGPDDEIWDVLPCQEGAAHSLAHALTRGRVLHIFAARMGETPKTDVTPTQRIYDNNASTPAATRWFPAYRLVAGTAQQPRIEAEIALSGAIESAGGLAWRAPLPDWNEFGDCMDSPRRSTLVVFEDGIPLGPPHCSHDEVRALGGGRFSHWAGEVVFSTSDNKPPFASSRKYVAALLARDDIVE